MYKLKNIKENKVIFMLWLVSFLAHLAVMNHFLGWFCTDTAGYWLHAATFTGHDWSEVAKNTSRYYSWGYSLLLIIPFILAPENMIVMSRIVICINALLCSLVVPLLYGIGRRVLRNVDKRILVICAFIVSCYSTYFLEASVALSESLLFFLYVFLVWLIVRYLSEKRKIWALSCSVCCGYMYIVHHRTLGIVVAFAIMLLIMYFRNKDYKELLVFSVPLLLCLMAGGLGDRWLMEREAMEGLYKGNTYGSMGRKISTVLSLEGLLLSIQNIIGAIWYILVGTFSTAFLGIISALKRVMSIIACDRKPEEREEKVFILYCFLILSFLLSLGISIVTTARTGYASGRIDVIFYGRYFEIVLSLFVFIGLIELMYLSKNKKRLMEIIALVVLMIIASIAVYCFTQMMSGSAINYFSVTAVLAFYSFPNFGFSPIPVSAFAVMVVGLIVILCWSGGRYRIAAYCLVAGCFIYIGYNAVVNVDNQYKYYANVIGYPTQSQEIIHINDYINENKIESFGVCSVDGYEAFSYQLMNPQRKVYSISSIDEIQRLQGCITHIIIPLSSKSEMDTGKLEVETVNYAIYDVTLQNGQ